MRIAIPLFLGCLLLNNPACADEVRSFAQENNRQRYLHLIEELRCLVCQNQNLADSDAALAQDLRDEVYRMIKEGKSDADIIAFMVERYGDFVLYKPPMKNSTLLLWFGPFLFLGLGATALIVFLIRRNEKQTPQSLSDAQKQHLANLLKQRDSE